MPAWVSTVDGLHLRRRRKVDTVPEMLLRRALHAQGARFRLHRRLAPGCTAPRAYLMAQTTPPSGRPASGEQGAAAARRRHPLTRLSRYAGGPPRSRMIERQDDPALHAAADSASAASRAAVAGGSGGDVLRAEHCPFSLAKTKSMPAKVGLPQVVPRLVYAVRLEDLGRSWVEGNDPESSSGLGRAEDHGRSRRQVVEQPSGPGHRDRGLCPGDRDFGFLPVRPRGLSGGR
jgi:hypothetical protein